MAASVRGAVAVRPASGPDLVVLAIESATVRPSVALLEGERVLALRGGTPTASAAAVVLPWVGEVLAEAGVALGEVALFALAIGPGSFTGLRVGLATVKGLAFGGEVPVAPVPTLAALCLAAGSDSAPVAALLDARRGEVYAAAYGPGRTATEPAVLLAEGLYRISELATRLPREWRTTGDGAPLLAAARTASGGEPGLVEEFDPAAPAVGRIGLQLAARGRAQPAATLVPRYLRRAEAEARRTGEALEREKLF